MLLAAERAERVRVCALTITAAGTQTVIIGPTTINLVNPASIPRWLAMPWAAERRMG